jgi:hypothetical protein
MAFWSVISFKVKIFWMHGVIELAEASCFGRLHWRAPLVASFMEFAGLEWIRSCALMFYTDHLVSEGAL